jgi:hemolysin activation/secretion protein
MHFSKFSLRHALIAAVFLGRADPGAAQTFFGDLGEGVTVGVDQGSTSLLPEVDGPTRFLTFDTYGSSDVGPDIWSASLALPDVLAAGDQLDMVVVPGGVGGGGTPELLAFGLGYVGPLGGGGLEWFLRGDHGTLMPGDGASRAADLRIYSTNLSLGLRQTWRPAEDTTLRATLEFKARDLRGSTLGGPALEEDLRVIQASVQRETGVPFGFRTRLGLSLAHGLDGLGASDPANPLASLPGASSEFMRFSVAAEMSLPVSPLWVINAGVAVQWADASLPLSERCGYATNAFSRGFDRTVANGDHCIAGRLEAARYVVLPTADRPDRALVQGFAGIDGGIVRDLANPVLPARTEGWSSLSLGFRVLRSGTVGEVAVSRVLDDFAGHDPAPRVWVRLGVRM